VIERGLIASLIFALTVSATGAHPAESVVRQFLALAYDGNFDALPVSQSVRMKRFERQVRNVLRVRCVHVEDATLTVLPKSDDRIDVHADVVISKIDPQGPGSFAVDEVLLRFVLTRRGERWLISEAGDRNEDLAEELLCMDGDSRERFLEEHPERVTKGLTRALYARAIAFVSAANFAEAGAAADVTRHVAIAAGDRGGEALALVAATNAMVPVDTALRFTAESVAIAETTGEIDVLARAWFDRGRAVRVSGPGNEGPVIAIYEKARQLAARAEDPRTLTQILYSLANHHATTMQDYVAARRYADEGMVLALEIDDEMFVMALETVLTAVYASQGDRERGLFHHQRALEIAERRQSHFYPSLLVRSADLLVADGRLEEAKAVLDRVLIRTDSGLKQVRAGTLLESHFEKAVRILAHIEAENGNLSEAVCLIRQADRGEPNRFLFELAPYDLARNDATAALDLSLTSLTRPQRDPSHRAMALLSAGRAYRRLGMVERALDAALEAIEIRAAIDARVAGDEQQRAYASITSSDYYELAAQLTIDGGDPLQALAFLERGRGRVLTDILKNERMVAVDEQQAALERDVVRVSVELDRARSAKNEKAVKTLTAELDRVRAARASFADGVRARSERQQASRREIDGALLLDIAKHLPPQTAAIEYTVSEDELHAFVISRDPSGEPRIVVRTIRSGRKDVERKVNLFVAMLSERNLRVKTAGRELYDLLVRPIESDISGAEALLVIPDEMLWRVPFAALVDDRDRYLAERTAIVYAPSLTAFATIVDSSKKRRSQPASLFAVGNPTLDGASREIATSYYRGVSLAPLPDAEHEVDALRALYDKDRSVVLKREEATESKTKTALRDAAVAHFATHGILDDANPMYSRLMLARGEGENEDGWLEGWEVARLDLNADLVVLSACDTARGRIGGGEGVVGLSWSFFLAGAGATVATQWKVASASTAELMIAFHRALRAPVANAALHKAYALREAQLHMMRDPQTRHPFHWAAFVLMGDPSR